MRKPSYRAPRYWPVHLALGLLRLMRHWPLPLLRALGRALGHGLWYLTGERRRIVETNLILCFPDWTPEQRRQVARECFALTGAAMLDLAPLWFGERKHWQDSVRIEGLERIAALQAQGRGVIILGFHFNDLELGGIALSPHVQRLAAMYRPHANQVFEHAMRSGRQRALQLIDRDDVRAMMKWLKTGGAIWYAADQDYGRAHSVFVPFFGIETATITALSRFAKMGNAVVLPLLHRKDGEVTVLEIGAPLPIPGASETDDALCVNQVLEQHLRQHPANYMWMHRRFKTQPEGKRSFYVADSRDANVLSARRLTRLQQAGTQVPAFLPGTRCLQMSDSQLMVLFPRRYWFWASIELKTYRRVLLGARSEGFERPLIVTQKSCPALNVDVLFLSVPPGNALAIDSEWSDEEKRARIARLRSSALVTQGVVLADGAMHYWKTVRGNLCYLGQ